jgi:cytidylate kinase
MKSGHSFIIAVDGHSSCGKSSFAKLISKELNYVYIDSGAMYRAVALYALNHHLIHEERVNSDELIRLLDKIQILFRINPLNGVQETMLNGENVEENIRGFEVSQVVSKISQIKEVREKMVSLQRSIGTRGGVVMDGRDIGSVVFPGAELKIFMTAQPEVRAQRRFKELINKGIAITFEEVKANIRMRDHEDENRKISPLQKADDAVILDNSSMTIEQQMVWFKDQWRKITNKHEH